MIAEDLEFLTSDPIRPYVGAGLGLGGSYSGSATGSGYLCEVLIPFGLEYPITNYLSVGVDDWFSSTTNISESWGLSQFSLGFGYPSLFVSLWFT